MTSRPSYKPASPAQQAMSQHSTTLTEEVLVQVLQQLQQVSSGAPGQLVHRNLLQDSTTQHSAAQRRPLGARRCVRLTSCVLVVAGCWLQAKLWHTVAAALSTVHTMIVPEGCWRLVCLGSMGLRGSAPGCICSYLPNTLMVCGLC